MSSTRITPEEKLQVLSNVRPLGQWKSPKERRAFGNPPTRWETQLGDLDEWRAHPGLGRAIVKKLADPVKNDSVRVSIQNRLRVLHPTESWVTFVDGAYICLKFNGERRTRVERQKNDDDGGNEKQSDDDDGQGDEDTSNGLFAKTG